MENKKFSLFQGISLASFAQMMHCFGAIERSFQPKEIICDYGKANHMVGVLQKGKAQMVRIDTNGNRAILEDLEEGDIFGEVLAFSGLADSIFVICQEKCDVLFIDYERIAKTCENACDHHNALIQNLLFLISNKTVQLSQRVEVLSRRSIREKLLCYFRITAMKKNSDTFLLPFSMSGLADYICVDRSAMMREIKAMKQEGLLQTDRRMIKILGIRPY